MEPIDLKQLLIDISEQNASKLAIVSSNENLTYAEISTRSGQLARWLISHGIGPGSIVPIAFERSPEMIIAMLAIIAAGAAYLPIDIDSPAARINDILIDSRATLMLSTAAVADNFAFADHVSVHRLDAPDMVSMLKLHAGSYPLQQDLIRPLTASDAPYVIYTSGTTGKPKGVVNTHAGVVNSLTWMADALALTSSDRCLLKAPYTFDLSVWEIFVPLSIGACLVIADPGGHRNPGYIAELIARHGVTFAYFVPTMLGELLSDEGVNGPSSLRSVVAIGEALTSSLQKRFHAQLPDTALWNSYGPTEAAVGVSLWLCRRDQDDQAPPLGFPAWNTKLYVLDDNLEQVAPGKSGEIYISGIQVATGYLEQPALTREKFLPCPFELPATRMYRTGDFGIQRSDGHIDFVGRQDGQLKVNGIRVELSEIEAATRSLPGVARCVVVPRVIQGATMLVAYLVMRDGVAPMESTELTETLLALLPSYMVPSLTVTLKELPLTTSGKLDVKSLPEPEVSGFAPYRDPLPGLETEIARLFSELTGFSPVGADHSFFALGGTSLMAMRLAGRLKARTGLALPMRALVECPTPATLSAALQQGPLPAPGVGSKPVVIMFPGAGGDDLQYARLGAQCASTLDLRTLPYPDWRTICRAKLSFDDIITRITQLIEATLAPDAMIRLGGYSLGGDIAYGVAARLEAAGRTITFLGLIDTDAAGRHGSPTKPRSRLNQATRLWRNSRFMRRVRDKTLDTLPYATLPLAASIIKTLGKSNDIEFQMSKRVMVKLRAAWQAELRTAPPRRPVLARSVLFQSEELDVLGFRYDGWPERCADLSVVPVRGTHLTMLDPDLLEDFATTFVACALPSGTSSGKRSPIDNPLAQVAAQPQTADLPQAAML